MYVCVLTCVVSYHSIHRHKPCSCDSCTCAKMQQNSWGVIIICS